MQNVKALNAILWGLNGLVGAGILVFAWMYLLVPADPEETYLAGMKWEEDTVARAAPPKPRANDDVLRTLRNPVTRDRKDQGSIQDGPSAFKASLVGTLPPAAAFIKATSGNVEMPALVNQEIRYENEVYADFRGWKLVEVSKEKAIFSDGSRKETLEIDLKASPSNNAKGRPGSRYSAGGASGPYNSRKFKTRLLASAANRTVWGVDPAEIEWAKKNLPQIMDRDFQVTPHAGGGLKITRVRAGSIGASRGIVAGDIVKSLNGRPLKSLGDLKMLMANPSSSRRPSLSLTIERAGKTMVIEYRALPKPQTSRRR